MSGHFIDKLVVLVREAGEARQSMGYTQGLIPFDALRELLHDDGINIWTVTAWIVQYILMRLEGAAKRRKHKENPYILAPLFRRCSSGLG